MSHCASCDGPLLRGQVAVVVGGGDTGMQEGLTLADHVAKVILLERGGGLTGQASYREQIAANPKIETRFGVTVAGIGGQDAVTHVRIRELASGAESDLEVAAVFPKTGHRFRIAP